MWQVPLMVQLFILLILKLLPNSTNISYQYDSLLLITGQDDGSFLGAKRVFWGTNKQRLQDMTWIISIIIW